ncbi:TPR-like protein [Epithele typhae]|uniref:TPR-like protein n=1 Tax=Epithele typhae TaxID=378194 RepID=UPI0020084C28|nr:TPR-like protein [Epithele typhae]KAH9912260.1 TPR-like protein [Epithele typhae]
MSNKQRLVLSVIDFLNQSIDDGTVKQDDKESLEVAIQCIGEAFGVDPADQAQVDRLSVKPANLLSIFDVFLKTKDKLAGPSAPGPSSAGASSSTPTPPTGAAKAEAEKLKAAGNAQMSAKKYDDAVRSYTDAIALDPTNPVYFSNRAAAHSSKGDHADAVADAESAIDADPSFVKAYHRLGCVLFVSARALLPRGLQGGRAAFQRGLDIEPSNSSLKVGLANAQARIVPDDDEMPPLEAAAGTRGAGADAGAGGMPDMGGMAEMLSSMGMGGGAAGGGAGGMPDLSSILGNPQMMSMAQQMMANGGLERMMQNPTVANMMNRMQSGGGMPSMSELMGDPAMRDLARQFSGGQ